MQLLQDILVKLLDILLESGAYILLGLLIAGLLHVFFPESLFSKIFGKQGIRPLLRAIGLGALIPVCSCGVIPIGIGAYHSGAGLGTALAFMTATPTISPASLLLSSQLLGLELTIWQAVFVIGGSFALGLAANLWFGGPRPAVAAVSNLVPLELSPQAISCCSTPHDHDHHHDHVSVPAAEPAALSCCSGKDHAHHDHHHAEQVTGWRGALQKLWRWLFVDFGPSVSLDMLVGLLVAACILTVVPNETIVLLTGSKTFLSLLLVVLVAIPIYTCSMAAIPLVFSFMMAGMSPGAAVAFIIAGPAANFGGLNAIRARIGWKTAMFYFCSLLLISVTAGYLIDHGIQPTLPQAVTNPELLHNHHQGHSWLEWASVSILLALFLIEITKRGCSWLSRFKTPTSTPLPASQVADRVP